MDTALPILCAGSAHWDIIARTDRRMRPGHDVPGRIARQPGGVALNVALALAARGARSALLSYVGSDPQGHELVALAAGAGVDCSHVTRGLAATDSYLAIEDGDGDVFGAVADCAALERSGAAVLAPLGDGRLGSPAAPWRGVLVIDGNFPGALLDSLPADPAFAAARVALVPASPGKAGRLGRAMTHPGSTVYLNRIEAGILCAQDFPDAASAAAALIGRGAARAVVTDGARACAAADAQGCLTLSPPAVRAMTATGAGDVFLAAHLVACAAGAAAETALHAAAAAAAAHVSAPRKEPR